MEAPPSVPTPRIVAALDDRVDELVATTVHDIQARLPVYRDLDDAAHTDVCHHVRRHFELLRDVLHRGRPAEAGELEFITRSAAVRARAGIPLEAFLAAFRSYHGVVWDLVLGSISTIGEEEALAAAGMVMHYIDLATTEAAAKYLEAQQMQVATADRVRRDLLDDLLAGRPPSTAAGLAVARDARLHQDGACVVTVALATDAPEDDAALLAAATTLARALAGPAPPLVVVRRGEIVLVRAVDPRHPRTFHAALDDARVEIERRGLTLGVGVSTVHTGIDTLGEAYREASSALRSVAGRGGVVSLPDLSVFDYLTMRPDAVAHRLVGRRVRAFVQQDGEHGGALARTVLAFAAANLNAKVAADALRIHVNTAHHRLGRIAAETGRDPRDVSDLVELVLAVRLAQATPAL